MTVVQVPEKIEPIRADSPNKVSEIMDLVQNGQMPPNLVVILESDGLKDLPTRMVVSKIVPECDYKNKLIRLRLEDEIHDMYMYFTVLCRLKDDPLTGHRCFLLRRDDDYAVVITLDH